MKKVLRFVNAVVRRVGRIAVWSCEPGKLWVAVFGLPFALLIGWAISAQIWTSQALPPWEPRFRIAGLMLQFMGVGVVAKGLHDRRKLFDRPSLWEMVVRWLKRFPARRVDAVVVVGGVAATLGVGKVTACGTTSLPENAPLLQRIAAVEQGQRQLFELVHQTQARIDQEVHARITELHSERNERAVQDQQTRTILEATAAEGLHWEFIGVFGLVFGLMLATASPELAKLLAR